MKNLSKEELKKLIGIYLGSREEIKDIEVFQDPMNHIYFAIKVIFKDNCDMHLLYNSSCENVYDALEEIEFTQWPPTSNAKNMFKLENMTMTVM